jgi:hypothetical protein
MSDTVTNKGLAIFFQGAEADYAGAIIVAGDSVVAGGDDYPLIPKRSRGISPLLSKSQREWDQGKPFNEFCFTSLGRQALVGCVAIAVGQVMSYFYFPYNYADYNFNWIEMNSNHESKDLHMFLKFLGNPENLNSSYGIGATGSLLSNIARTFENMGYNRPGEFSSFQSEGVLSGLNTSPVLVYGRNLNDAAGHLWVVDGYLQYEDYDTKVSLDGEVVYEDPLYHCVWGWGGICNGYFYLGDGIIYPNNPTEFDKDDSGNNDSEYGFYGLGYLANFSINSTITI